jgi:hypothetical protein
VQESGQHGGEAAGPVVRDIVKAYYDKKNKKLGGQQLTADGAQFDPNKVEHAAVGVQPPATPKPQSEATTTPPPARSDQN